MQGIKTVCYHSCKTNGVYINTCIAYICIAYLWQDLSEAGNTGCIQEGATTD